MSSLLAKVIRYRSWSQNSPDHHFFRNQYHQYLTQLLKTDPDMAQIYVTTSFLSTDDLSMFLKYLNRYHSDLNLQPLFNHICRLGILSYIKEFFLNSNQRYLLAPASILATLHGHYHLVKYFLKHQPKLISTLIFVAFHSNQFDLVEKILQIGTYTPHEAFLEACRQGHLFLVERILHHFPKLLKTLDSYDNESNVLLLTFRGGHYHIIRYLEEQQTNQNQLPFDDRLWESLEEAVPIFKDESLSPHTKTTIQVYLSFLILFLIYVMYQNIFSGIPITSPFQSQSLYLNNSYPYQSYIPSSTSSTILPIPNRH